MRASDSRCVKGSLISIAAAPADAEDFCPGSFVLKRVIEISCNVIISPALSLSPPLLAHLAIPDKERAIQLGCLSRNSRTSGENFASSLCFGESDTLQGKKSNRSNWFFYFNKMLI